jgi:hypothetical protein
LSPLTAPAQSKTWQSGTVLEVKPRQAESNSNNAGKQYDVSIKVGKKLYAVLYTAEINQPDPGLYVGMARTVLIEGNTLKFNDLQGRTHPARILSSKDAPPSK